VAYAAKSSASIPFVFPPTHFKNRGTFMDGGTVYNVNMEAAVRQCMELVDDESKITVDVYICGAPTLDQDKAYVTNSIENYYRSW